MRLVTVFLELELRCTASTPKWMGCMEARSALTVRMSDAPPLRCRIAKSCCFVDLGRVTRWVQGWVRCGIRQQQPPMAQRAHHGARSSLTPYQCRMRRLRLANYVHPIMAEPKQPGSLISDAVMERLWFWRVHGITLRVCQRLVLPWSLIFRRIRWCRAACRATYIVRQQVVLVKPRWRWRILCRALRSILYFRMK
jgi:hypothetical protein